MPAAAGGGRGAAGQGSECAPDTAAALAARPACALQSVLRQAAVLTWHTLMISAALLSAATASCLELLSSTPARYRRERER